MASYPEAAFSYERCPARLKDFRLEQLDDELLLYHPAETKILYLNRSASLVWGLCDGDRTVAEMTELLRQAYPEAALSIQEDVASAIRQFIEFGCIEWK